MFLLESGLVKAKFLYCVVVVVVMSYDHSFGFSDVVVASYDHVFWRTLLPVIMVVSPYDFVCCFLARCCTVAMVETAF